MSQAFKSVSLVSIMLLSVLSGMVIASDFAEANTVVITEPQQIVDGGSASDTQTAIVGDSQGNAHNLGKKQFALVLLHAREQRRDSY